MSAVFAHGDLRLYLMHLLEEQPQHGYELMQRITDRFGGTYSPSAGTIYPRLAKLEAEGFVVSEPQGRTTSYALTDEGRAYLAANEARVDEMLGSVSASVRTMADEVRQSVRESMKTLRADLAAARDAAREAPAAQPPASESAGPPRDTARFALAEIESELAKLRSVIRRRMRGGELDEVQARSLRDEIVSIRERMRR